MTRHSLLLGGLLPLLLLAAACSSASQPPAAALAPSTALASPTSVASSQPAAAKEEAPAPGGAAASVSAPSAPPTPMSTAVPMPTAMQVAMAAPEPFLFAEGGRILLTKPDGAPDRTLSSDKVWAGSPAWSPDRSRVAYVVLYPPEAKGAYVAKADGSGTPVKVSIYGLLETPPVWSPDGLQLAIREKAGANQGIWTVNADGTGLTRLYDKNIADLTWSPDGWTIAFSLNPSPASGGVYAVSAYGGTPRLVAPLLRAGSLAYSPDGKHIAVRSQAAEGRRVLSTVKGTGQLHVVTVSSGEMRQVATGLGGDAWRPVWANPYSIAVIQEGEGGQALAVVSRTGEAMSVLAQGSQFQGLSWSKDGSALQCSVTTADGTFPMHAALQEIGMAWTMDMDMTRNMKLDQGQVLKDSKMQPLQTLMMASMPTAAATPAPTPAGTPAAAAPTTPPTGIRMARLAFDKYT